MKNDLNAQQIAVITEKFAACAGAQKVITMVVQPTGERGLSGKPRGRVRILVQRDWQLDEHGNRARTLAKAIKAGARDIFRSVHITVTPYPETFDRSLRHDAQLAAHENHPHRLRPTPVNRHAGSGEPVVLNFSA